MNNKQDIVSRLESHFYPERGMDVLDAAFAARAKPGMKVLDAGCGGSRGCTNAAPLKQMYIVGVDLDSAVLSNPFCNEAVVSDLCALPFLSKSFDLIHCRWVLEHIKEPINIFSEFARVLKPGGRLLVLTPNVFHYATTIAKLTPQRFHQWWWKDDYDPFPTYYRANSVRKLRQLCNRAGFKVQKLELIETQPLYFNHFWPGFLVGVFYERIVNSTSLLAWARHRIVLEAILEM